MEDYKKKYEDALERARQVHTTNVDENKKSTEYIFPELKESEDEKSKKWILEYLYDGLRKSDEQFKDQFKAAISWLEKQVSPQMVADAYLRGCNDTEKKWIKKQGEMDIEMDIEKPITIGKRMAVSGKLKELIDNKDSKSIEETKEKMLAETSNWSEEDEMFWNLSIEAATSYYGLPSETVNWLKSIKERVHPKPQWTEEDDIGFGDTLWAINKARTIAKDENDMGNLWYAENWLKELKERIGG